MTFLRIVIRLKLLLEHDVFAKTGIHFSASCSNSFNDLADRQQCGHDRDDEAADHDADGYDRQRSGNADHAVETALQLRLEELGHPAAEHGELSRLLTET